MKDLCLLSFLAVGLLLALCRRRRSRGKEESTWLPSELRSARLIYAEKLFKTWRPFPLSAKVDRAYMVNATIVLVELKTRAMARMYLSDIIQLSAQRVAIAASTDDQVSSTAYVAIQQHPADRHKTVLKVELLSTTQVVSLARRFEDLCAGRLEPTKTDRSGLCTKCAFVATCKPELAKADTRG